MVKLVSLFRIRTEEYPQVLNTGPILSKRTPVPFGPNLHVWDLVPAQKLPCSQVVTGEEQVEKHETAHHQYEKCSDQSGKESCHVLVEPVAYWGVNWIEAKGEKD